MSAETARVLRKAADLIERQGWTTGWGSCEGPMCVGHALFHVVGSTSVGFASPAAALLRYVGWGSGLWRGSLNGSLRYVGLWNDQQDERTVIDALRAAATEADS